MPGITLNPDPSGDDWTQITAAMATLRANRLGWVEFEQLSSATPFNIKRSVDATGLWSASIRFAPGTIIRCDGFTGDGTGRTAPMFDLSNSGLSELRCEGNSAAFIQGMDTNSPVGTVKPNCAILIANVDSKKLNNICTSGEFSSAAIGIVSCADIDIVEGGFGNTDPNAPVFVISSNPDYGLWSPYSTFDTYGFANDIYLRTRIHGEGRQLWTTFMRNCNNVMFNHCLFDANQRGHIIAQGTSNDIVLNGGKGYSELGVALTGAIIECGSPDAITNCKMIGFGTGGIPNTTGSGNFAGLQVL